jgi:AcrR family transcriptional regulator
VATHTHKTTDNTYHHGNLRRALLEATLEIIDTEGLEAVSLRAVARQLGVSEAAPYHHFASKQDLLAVLAADAYRGLGERLTDALRSEGSDPFERLSGLVRAYVQYGLEHRGRYRLMFGEHMIGLGDYIRAHGHDLGVSTRNLLRDLVADCLGDDHDTEAISNTVWALSHGITGLINEAEIRYESREDTQHLVDVGVSILISGIRTHTDDATRSTP